MNSTKPSRKTIPNLEAYRRTRESKPFPACVMKPAKPSSDKDITRNIQKYFLISREVLNKTLGSPVQPFTKRTLYHV